MDIHLRIIQFYHDVIMLVSLFQLALFGDRRHECLCGMDVQLLDGLFTVASPLPVNNEDTWSTTITPVNDFRRHGVYRPNSWTIVIYDRNHQAGDTVWCRVWNNEMKEFCEYEDTEVLKVVNMILMLYPKARFYMKKVRNGVSVFEANLIVHVLTTILHQAKRRDGIYIPSKDDLLIQFPPRKEKRGFLTSIRFRAQSAGNR